MCEKVKFLIHFSRFSMYRKVFRQFSLHLMSIFMAVSHTSHHVPTPHHAAESSCCHPNLLSTGWRWTCRTLLLPIDDDATWCGGTDHNRCIVAAALVVVVVVRRRRLPIVKVLVGFGLGLLFGSLVIL